MRVLTFVVTCDYIDFWTLCFAHHFVYCCHFTRFLIKFFACLYLTTMQILWARKYEYGVLFITHAREIFKSLVFDSWLENFSSICDEQNTILTFPPHSIYTMLLRFNILQKWKEQNDRVIPRAAQWKHSFKKPLVPLHRFKLSHGKAEDRLCRASHCDMPGPALIDMSPSDRPPICSLKSLDGGVSLNIFQFGGR